MGYSARAHAIIGIRIDNRKLWTQVGKKACSHAIPKNSKFCPECGVKNIIVPEKKPIKGYEKGDGDYGTVAGFKLGSDGCENEPEFIAGFDPETGSSNGGEPSAFSPIPDIAKIKADMKSKLEPLGLWNEKAFGIYAVLYASY